GSLTDELKRSPINSITVHGTAGSGHVNLKEALVQSPAFEADAKGDLILASLLTNSTLHVPVSISLSRAIAQRLNLLPTNAATDAPYARLPDFFTMKGTIGDPKSDINKSVLLGMAAKGLT